MRLDDAVALQSGVTRSQARGLILAGRVRVNGDPITKSGTNVRDGAQIEVERAKSYVSRGGEKLEQALTSFGIDPSDKRALDIGASTGGFTDCLLRFGAAHVTAVDVGYGQLAWRLRNDPRVRVVERTNFRYIENETLGEPFDLIVIDVSFISLRPIVERARSHLALGGAIVALVKPQFEAGRERVRRGGVVRDPEVHVAVLREVREAMNALDLRAISVVASPLLGPAGNREFFILVKSSGEAISDEAISDVVGVLES
ncbi:MAG: TlyA family RNA methyltransferase [Candidatus Eremiobacteraeota bacterium]|nr:TlyA family RNA methyltransferase [Candidatus Eremiobacteraeota bacterium]